jgi:hypothetical protein
MTRRPRLEAALRTKARLCHAYGIRWREYGSLTLGEQRILLELLDAAQAELELEAIEAAPDPPPAAPARPAPPGMERVC